MRIIYEDERHEGFFWVERITLPNGQAARLEPTLLNNQTGFTGEWRLRCSAISDIFVGSGEVGLNGVQMAYQFARRGDNLIIPSTSLKGPIRMMAEMLTPSCMGGNSHCKSCPACSLFGSLGRQGRLCLDDASFNSYESEVLRVAQRTSPKRSQPDGAPTGEFRKLYRRDLVSEQASNAQGYEHIEVVKVGATFDVVLRFHHAAEWELGLLLLAMGVAPSKPFRLKLGGAKNRGLGLVEFSWSGGSYAKGSDWMFNKRTSVDETALAHWSSSLDTQMKEWRIEKDVTEIIAYIQSEYTQ